MMYVKFPLSLRNVEDLLHERGIDLSYETVRFWWNRFGPMFAGEIRRKRVERGCQPKPQRLGNRRRVGRADEAQAQAQGAAPTPSVEVIGLVVLMYVRYPLSLRNVEDLLFERGIDICHETVRHWWNRFGPMFAGEVRRKRVHHMRQFTHWRWHLDEMYVRVGGEMRYLWRAVDHEGEVLESLSPRCATGRRR
jgi:putative transposase